MRVLSSADALLLTEVYSAGEDPIIAADSKSLARSIRVQGKVEPIYVEHLDEVKSTIQTIVQEGDVVLVMGAGSIGKIAPDLAESATKLTLITS